jgi:hypothetical protein
MSGVVIAGDTSGSITLQAPAVSGSSVLTLPVATDTLVGKATTDTLTNKTLTAPTITGATTIAAGTALLPALTTTGDTNTGFWFPAADTIAASTGGTERIRISSGGNVGIACTPSRRLSVQYDFAKTDTSSRAIAVFKSNDATNANEMLISSTGAATQASRVWNVQTGEDGVSNAGIVSLQADGGNVTVGRATVVDSAKLSLFGGSLGGLGFATSQNATTVSMAIDSLSGFTTRKDSADFWHFGRSGSANCVSSGGSWVNSSDKSLKENVVTLPDALNKVCSLRGVSFNRISSGQPEIGLIAQEVQQVYPDVVEVGDYLGLNYGALVGALVEAIKDLKIITEAQAARITALETT